MIAATAFLSIAVFICGLWLLGVVRVGVGSIATARVAFAALRDETLDDEGRERAVQQASLKLFGAFASILVRFALTFLVSLLPIWLADQLAIAEWRRVVEFLSRWDVIVGVTLILSLGYWLVRLLWTSR